MRLGLFSAMLVSCSFLNANEAASGSYKIPFENCFKSELFVSGEDCYTKFNKPEYRITEWQFLEVSVDYKSNQFGNTKISYKLSPNFSVDKKTVIYFNGGPGGTSVDSDFVLLDDVNVIYFNQRGAAFSRPENQELFLNQDYYSSENTARDALEIVKHLGLKQVIAYGMSYGTVPATIFGHLFPQYTHNVILEGVVYDGQSRLWYASHRIKLLQKYFDKLDPSLKESILKYSRQSEIFPGWFSSIAQKIMYDANFEKRLTSSLKELLDSQGSLSPEDNEKRIIEKLKSRSYDSIATMQDMLWFSPTMFKFIACKELNGQNELSNFDAVFNEKDKLIPYENKSNDVNGCQKLNITKTGTYSAENYPLSVPVYYFQGTTDGATTAEFAVWHYKKAAKGKAMLVLAKQAGHSVVIQHLSSKLELREEEKKNPLIVAENEKLRAQQSEIIKIFKAAINNETLDVSKLNQLIGDKKSEWVKTQK